MWAVEARILFTPTAPIEAVGQKPYLIEAFDAGVPVGQTFRSKEDWLESVDLGLWADSAATVDVTARLMGWAPSLGSWASLYEWKAQLRLPKGTSWQRFTFKPVPQSARVVYQFQLQHLETRPADGVGGRPKVAILGSEDDALQEGNLIVGPEQIVERDLIFHARCASIFTDWHLRVSPELPRFMRGRDVQLAFIALYNFVLAVWAYYFIVRGPESSESN